MCNKKKICLSSTSYRWMDTFAMLLKPFLDKFLNVALRKLSCRKRTLPLGNTVSIKRCNLVYSVQVGGTGQSNMHMNARTTFYSWTLLTLPPLTWLLAIDHPAVHMMEKQMWVIRQGPFFHHSIVQFWFKALSEGQCTEGLHGHSDLCVCSVDRRSILTPVQCWKCL